MLLINKLISLLLLSMLMYSCSSNSEKMLAPSVSGFLLCKDPRPQVCTREYNPVCAVYKDGSKKTGATGCTACSDPDVAGYTMGACESTAAD